MRRRSGRWSESFPFGNAPVAQMFVAQCREASDACWDVRFLHDNIDIDDGRGRKARYSGASDMLDRNCDVGDDVADCGRERIEQARPVRIIVNDSDLAQGEET